MIKLYDTTGKIILTEAIQTETLTFRLPHKGIYILIISSNNKVENKKIIW